MTIYKLRRVASQETNPMTPWSWISSFQDWEKIPWCCLSCPGRGAVPWEPRQTDTALLYTECGGPQQWGQSLTSPLELSSSSWCLSLPHTPRPPCTGAGTTRETEIDAQDGHSRTPAVLGAQILREDAAPRQVKEHVGGVGPRAVYVTPQSTYSRPFAGEESETQRGRVPCLISFTAQLGFNPIAGSLVPSSLCCVC